MLFASGHTAHKFGYVVSYNPSYVIVVYSMLTSGL